MSQVTLGTVSVTNGSNAVTVSGLTTGADGVAVGNMFKVRRNAEAIYTIASRTPSSGPSITSLTLSVNYGGSTGSGLNYEIVKDFTSSRGYPEFGAGDLDVADVLTQAIRMVSADVASLMGALPNTTPGLEFVEISDLAAPASNKARIYVRDNGSGKTQLVVRFPTGAIQVISTEP
jgi:hypothetical protein